MCYHLIMHTAFATEQATLEPTTVERIDDIPLLVALQQKIGIAEDERESKGKSIKQMR